MPSPSDFRRAFSLECGRPLGEEDHDRDDDDDPCDAITMRIQDLHVGHDVITSFVRYEFPIVLHVIVATLAQPLTTSSQRRDGEAYRKHVLKRLQSHHSGKHIVYSSYGSPYECTIPSKQWQVAAAAAAAAESESSSDTTAAPHSSTIITFQCTNRGVAVRRRDIPSLSSKKDTAEIVEAVAHLKEVGGYRIIKSHFASGRCRHCGEKILPGTRIAKNETESSPSGWGHVTCVVNASPVSDGSRRFVRSSDRHGSKKVLPKTRTRSQKAPSLAAKRYNLRPRPQT